MRARRNFKLTVLAVSLLVTAGVAFVSRLFAIPGLIGWQETGIASLASLIICHFASVIFIHKNKIVLLRYIFLVLLVISCIFYYNRKHSFVYSIPDTKQGKDTLRSHGSKSVIVGTLLNDNYKRPKAIELNKNRNIPELIAIVGYRKPEEIWTDVQRSKDQLTLSYILVVVFLVALLTHLTEEIMTGVNYNYNKDVFISYNHDDKNTATEINQALLKKKIKTVLDTENMTGGDDIGTFIRESIQMSRITLLIVSEKSLLSGWVATETVNTFFLEMYEDSKSFIACYLDNSFLDPEFPNKALKIINEKLEKINNYLEERNRLGSDSRDLNDQKTRLYMLKNNLDKIIQRLQNSMCIDVGSGKLNEAFPGILKAIKSKLKT